MANTKDQISPTTLKFFRVSKWLVIAGMLIIISNLFFLSVKELASGLKICGAFLVVAGCLVNLAGLFRGSREKSRTV